MSSSGSSLPWLSSVLAVDEGDVCFRWHAAENRLAAGAIGALKVHVEETPRSCVDKLYLADMLNKFAFNLMNLRYQKECTGLVNRWQALEVDKDPGRNKD